VQVIIDSSYYFCDMLCNLITILKFLMFAAVKQVILNMLSRQSL